MWQHLRRGELVLLSDRQLLLLALGIVAVVMAALWATLGYFEPLPPKRVTISTGDHSGGNFLYAKQYARAFEKQGVTLEVLESRGSVENIGRLRDPASGVQIALVQGGVGAGTESDELESLASVAYEPIWIFHRPPSPEQRLRSLQPLRGKRIAIGPEGSGSRSAALRFLGPNGVDARNTSFSDQTGSEAIDAVARGELDAAFLVVAVDAPSVQQAFAAGLEPVNFARADAYVRLMPWLSKLQLPQGIVNLEHNLPNEDIVLVAATTNLVVRKDLHPDIAYLLMETAADIHAKGTLTSAAGEFPNARELEFPQSRESRRFFQNGRPFLQRYLPFWAANLVERLAITLLPLLALIPLVRMLPQWFTWRDRARILRLYAQLKQVEREWEADPSGGAAAATAQLDRVERTLETTKLRVYRNVDVYVLKSHLDLLRARVASAR